MKVVAYILNNVKTKLDTVSGKGQFKDMDFLRRKQLREEINNLIQEMDVVQDHFENETDFDLIDAHILELNSLEVRYRKAIRDAKQMKLVSF